MNDISIEKRKKHYNILRICNKITTFWALLILTVPNIIFTWMGTYQLPIIKYSVGGEEIQLSVDFWTHFLQVYLIIFFGIVCFSFIALGFKKHHQKVESFFLGGFLPIILLGQISLYLFYSDMAVATICVMIISFLMVGIFKYVTNLFKWSIEQNES